MPRPIQSPVHRAVARLAHIKFLKARFDHAKVELHHARAAVAEYKAAWKAALVADLPPPPNRDAVHDRLLQAQIRYDARHYAYSTAWEYAVKRLVEFGL